MKLKLGDRVGHAERESVYEPDDSVRSKKDWTD